MSHLDDRRGASYRADLGQPYLNLRSHRSIEYPKDENLNHLSLGYLSVRLQPPDFWLLNLFANITP